MNKSSDVSNSDFKILFIMSLGPEKNEEILFHNVYKETLLIFRSKKLNIGKVFFFS